jgi:UDP-glucose 4-epimerase
MQDNQTFTLYGDQYETPDGTCIRDYVHVADIAQAHVLALDKEIPAGIYNLGTNTGASNREIISTAEAVTGESLTVEVGPIREGDPAMLTASADKFTRVSGWKPQYALVDIIEHAWRWYNR